MDWIDQAYINRLSLRLECFKQKKPGRYNFRCPICGDSAKDKYKTRGWIFAKDGKTKFHCFNDDSCGSSFSYFLKRVDPVLHAEYALEKFKEYGNQTKREINKIELEPPKRSAGDPDIVHDLPTIASLPKDHFARKYIDSRQLPGHWLDKLYFCDHWKALTNQFEPNTYETIYKDEPRIVIPAYNQQKELICFQGRSLDPEVDEKKYLTVKVQDTLKIWGMDRIKPGQRVYLLEGAFDAMFLNNTAAILGGSANPEDLPDGYEWVFVLDNEPRNVSVLRRYQQMVDRRAKFVSWKDWKYPWKDVNLCIQHGVLSRDIQKYFDANIVSGLTAQLELDKWKKVPLYDDSRNPRSKR